MNWSGVKEIIDTLPNRPASANPPVTTLVSVPFDTLRRSARAPQANPTLAEALAKTAPEVVTAN